MRKLVVVLEGGTIPELNNIGGPIVHPTRIELKNIAALVKNHKNVYECDPSDPNNEEKRIKLTTLEQVTGNNFGENKNVAPVASPVEPKKEEVKQPETPKEETPVEKKEDVKPENNNKKGNKKN